MLSSSQLSGNNGDGVSHSESDRNTKKVRFKDNIVEDDIGINTGGDPDPTPSLLWKDKLLGGSISGIDPDSTVPTEGNDNDLEFLEGDVNTTTIDGVPTITFSDCLKNLLLREMEFTVIVKLLGLNNGYNALHNRILSLWKPINSFRIMDTTNRYFLLNFRLLRITTEFCRMVPRLSTDSI
ncbi:hypothetical protein V6Z12_A07G161600 [Gossypium hirsutum]